MPGLPARRPLPSGNVIVCSMPMVKSSPFILATSIQYIVAGRFV